MAPFNHIGVSFLSNNPSNPPSTKEGEVKERNLHQDTRSERIQYKPRESISRRNLPRRSNISPRQELALDSDADDERPPGSDNGRAARRETTVYKKTIRQTRTTPTKRLSKALPGRVLHLPTEARPRRTLPRQVEVDSDSRANGLESSADEGIDSGSEDDDKTAIVNQVPVTSKTSEQVSTLLSPTPIAALPESDAIPVPAAVLQTIAVTPTPITVPELTVIPTLPVVVVSTSTTSSPLNQATITPIAVLQNAGGFGNNPVITSGAKAYKPDEEPDDPNAHSSDDDDDDDDDDTTKIAKFPFTTISSGTGSTISTAVAAAPETIGTPIAVGDLPSSAVSQSESDGLGALPATAGHQPLTPEAEHGLMALGVIGGLVLVGLVLYMLLRLRKVDVFACLPCRRNRRKDNGWASKSVLSSTTHPGLFGAFRSEKSTSSETGFLAFFNPITQGRVDSESPRGPAQTSRQRQNYGHNSLLHNAAPMPVTPLPSYNYTFQKHSQRGSDLSTLSSGFGDAVIDVPESGPSPVDNINGGPLALPKLHQQTLGINLGPRFSWANVPTPRTLGEHRKRDTMTTTTSGDSTPRFRTIKSWVDHQSSRLLRTQDSVAGEEREREIIPDLPAIPEAYTSNRHQRMSSGDTDVAFKAHPGNEIEMKMGARIPSTLLTRKLQL